MDKEVEKKFHQIEERLERLEDIVLDKGKDFSKAKPVGLEKLLIENVKKIATQHLVVISLKLRGKQTREELRKTLQDWGKVFGNWFRGGNFNNRLLKTNIVKPDGKNEDGEDLYSLTKRGDLLADELIEKIKLKSTKSIKK